MSWILVFWIFGSSPDMPPSVATQEFIGHKACVDAEIALRKQFDNRVESMCLQKEKIAVVKAQGKKK